MAFLFLEIKTNIRYRFAFLSCSVCFLISQPRVFGPKTEHESFFYVVDLVYAAGESARKKPSLSERKKRSLKASSQAVKV